MKDEEQNGDERNESSEIIAEDILENNEQSQGDRVIRKARQYLPQNQRVGEWVNDQKRHIRIPGKLYIKTLHLFCGADRETKKR